MYKKFILLTLLTTINASQTEAPDWSKLQTILANQAKNTAELGDVVKNLTNATANLANPNKTIVPFTKSRNPRILTAFVAGTAIGTGCTVWVKHKDVPQLRAAVLAYLQAIKQATANFTSILEMPTNKTLKSAINDLEREHAILRSQEPRPSDSEATPQ